MKNKTQFKINRLIQEIVYSDRKEGFLKIYKNNTREHELVKFLIADKLMRQGYKVYSECRFTRNRGKADLVVFSQGGDGTIVEVLNSESDEGYDEKLSKYPIEYNMVSVKTEGFDIDSWEL